jgi:pimeloyl-ACP methyl ester carboxylesterase
VTAANMRDGVNAPSTLLRWMEARAVVEAGSLVAASPFLHLVKRGDPHPVLVMPGFGASDRSTVALRWHIQNWGYTVSGWDMGANLGPTPEVIRALRERLLGLYEEQEKTVTLVGWSLGGIYARFLARHFPDIVRQVITLGSPFRMVQGDQSAVSSLAESLEHTWDQAVIVDRPPEHLKTELQVPSTAIYTRTDGVVRWHTCIDAAGPRRENVEVYGSHVGLGVSPSVLYVVGNRLAQKPGEWKPFRPPLALSWAYPRPAVWEESA